MSLHSIAKKVKICASQKFGMCIHPLSLQCHKAQADQELLSGL